MKKCIWCKLDESTTTFNKKAHTIPKSLGGQNFNNSVCDSCNHFFGNSNSEYRYSIETALKETFCITRQRLLFDKDIKRKIGEFKSIFFEVKDRKGKLRFSIKPSFKFQPEFQNSLCRNFKRGLLKMWLEEFDRQSKSNKGHESKYDLIRAFSRYNEKDIPVIYFKRTHGIFLLKKREAETPIIILNRMKYLYENEKFTEIEFLGHVFGFPLTQYSEQDFHSYIKNSLEIKSTFFQSAKIINKLTDIDLTLNIIDR